MDNRIEITIVAMLPADSGMLGHKALLATDDAAAAIAKTLSEMGLLHAEHSVRLVRVKGPQARTRAKALQAAPTAAPGRLAAGVKG